MRKSTTIILDASTGADHTSPLVIPCPYCEAEPGEMCHTRNSTTPHLVYCKPHAQRVWAFFHTEI